MNTSFKSALAIAGLVGATAWASPSFADVISVNASSSITSGSYINFYWGHENQTSVLITDPGTGTTTSQHGINGPSHIQTGQNYSTTDYTVTDPTAGEVDFHMGMNNTLSYGGAAKSYGDYRFTLTGDAQYDLSGSYASNQNAYFSVVLTDLDTSTTIYSQIGAGALGGAGLSGLLDAGNYQLSILGQTSTGNTGPTSGAGTGFVNFDLTAVPEPASLALLGLGLAGLAFSRRKSAS